MHRTDLGWMGASRPVAIAVWLLLIAFASRAEAQQGACCLTAGCIETTEATCQLLAGSFIGEGVPCDPNPCVPICSLDPSVLDFGRLTVGSSREKVFILENTGYLRATGSFSESCDGFQFISSAAYDLAPGESKSFTVRFLPQTEGSYECNIDGTECEGPLLLGEASTSSPICLVSPTSLDFGAIGIGQFRDRSITIRNVGDGLLVGSAAGCGPFTIVSGGSWELGAGEEQALVVRFRPTSEGPVSCTLSTSGECEDIFVRGVGEVTPACLVTPADLQFGDVILDTEVDRTFTIENTGAGSLTGNVRVDCPGFTLVGTSGYSLDAGQSKQFVVRFAPEIEGEAECEIELGNACGVLLAEGVAVRAPICIYTPSFLDFGNVPLGSSAIDSFEVKNFGGAPLVGSFVVDCTEFEILGDPVYELGAGESQVFEVRFTPAALGGIVCRLGGDGCEELPLRGFGIEGPECRIDPGELDLGAVPIGEVHRTSFILTNDGGSVLAGTASVSTEEGSASLYRFAATGGESLSYALAEGQELEVVVELVADELGSVSGEVTLGATGTTCPPVGLTADVEVAPECALSIDAWDFGTIALGESSETGVTVTNAGGARLRGEIVLDCEAFTLLTVDARTSEAFDDAGATLPFHAGTSAISHEAGPIAGPPGAGAGSFPYDLGAGESLEIFLRFSPESEGDYECEVGFGDSCGPVVLTGHGEIPPVCQVDRVEIDFGVVDLGEFADGSFLIENVGGGRLVGVVESPCPSFFFVGGPAYSLGPGESREITVRFVPDRSGPISCTLEVGEDCSSVAVGGVGNGPICVVSPSVLRFGTVLPGTSRDLSFVVSNAGGGTLRGSVTELCEAFSLIGVSGYELRAGESAVIPVRFEPRFFGDVACEIDLSTGCRGLEATGSGGEPPNCSIDVEQLDFGEVALGAVVRESFQIQNLGEGRLRGQVTANCAGFRVLGERSFDLGSEEIQSFEVELTAFEEGLLTCELDLGSDCRQLDAMADVRLPLGACCYADGSCVFEGADTCTRSGGVSWIEGVRCTDAGCLPIGACCATDGSCFLATEDECFAGAGLTWTEGAGCTSVECAPAGACCLLDGQCLFLVEEVCSGEFAGVGTTCDPSPCPRLGACCFPDGRCEVVTEDACTPMGGRSWSLGADCLGVSCEPVGACCFDSANCVVTTASGCTGEYLGDSAECTPGVCLPVGACCLVDETCELRREDLCTGTFLGEDVVCTPEVCAPKVEEVRVVRTESGAELEVVTPAGAVTGLEGWYRVAGTFTYLQIGGFERREDAWVSRFDPEATTVRGVEYYLSYVDEALGLRVMHGQPDTPRRLRIAGEASFPWPPSGEFRMVAAPFELTGAETIQERLEAHLGPSGDRSWKVGRWSPLEERYVHLDPSSVGAFAPGLAYWAVFAGRPEPLQLTGRTYFPPERSYTYPIRLQPGWNMIGNPAAYTIETDPSRSFIADRGDILTLEDASRGDSPRVSDLYAYAPGSAGPHAPYEIAPLHLDVWEGAWIENRSGHAITLLLPAVDATSGDAARPTATTLLGRWSEGWPAEESRTEPSSAANDSSAPAGVLVERRVEVRSGGELRTLSLGVAADARAGFDRWDLSDPPTAPGARLSASWKSDATPREGAPRRLLRDVRPSGSETLWFLEVASDDPIEIRFPDPGVGADGGPLFQVRLDEDEPWRSLGSLRSWILPEGGYRLTFRGVVDDPEEPGGSEDPDDPQFPGGAEGMGLTLDLRTEPHPIRGDATLLLSQPTPGPVRLDCYDARGARIFFRATGSLPAGTHLLRWDGRDMEGRRIERGTYFLRLSTTAGQVTRKIVVFPGR